MGNRFLRHTAFDILEDGRIEQTFFRQTKDFLFSQAAEHRYQINTASRNYEMSAKHDQLAADSQAFVATLVQGLQSFIDQIAHTPALCTVALTARAAVLPGLDVKLRSAGFVRQLRLHPGAAACGAAHIGANRLRVPTDVAEVPVECSVPLTDTRRLSAAAWEARLQKARARREPLPSPTHAIVDGIGHGLAGAGRFTIGGAGTQADLMLPESFPATDDCVVPLLREGGRLWMVDATATRFGSEAEPRVAIEAGDRLTIRCGAASAEILFVHCANSAKSR